MTMGRDDLQAVTAGLVCAVVGFTSSFAVVLAGLRAVGATQAQAASGLLVLCLTMGLGCIVFSLRTRMPVTMAWSTPGAALLATTGATAGGFAGAVGAFAVCGVLLALCGAVPWLEKLVERIPAALASAMLAGILLTICAKPFVDLPRAPWQIGCVLLAWLVTTAFARRWAVLAALAAALIVMGVDGAFSRTGVTTLAPHLEFVTPHLDATAMVAIALPLFLVTMTSQNLPGVAVLASFGYRLGLRKPLLYTGAAGVAGSVACAHAINLAAISAALASGPEAHPDRDRRWIAGVACGVVYVALAPASAAVVAVALVAPQGLLAAVAAVALFGTFAAAAGSALEPVATREAAAVTLVVAGSGVTLGGVGSAFWSVIVGLLVLGVGAVARRRATPKQ
ncbi:benzoate/H(+) symporter BenE family transporter [Dermacoccus sp. PAMC28757]|uniref:benzoate/H(+) symporter BenE family transporter n=1 Tax=Dermacoccus sp. PAMC28757 TaxID=2762331 RepID=UPI00164DCC3A|nr:benzoate/H(+) symporter BenE family transporter [Dermacoccus sp. PAMC28757]QNK52260.1 benzoate/H(+) symporter BenE family transporter [Dermacoccus sp. PAMC28757]